MKKAIFVVVFVVGLFAVSTLGAFTLAGFFDGKGDSSKENPNSSSINNVQISDNAKNEDDVYNELIEEEQEKSENIEERQKTNIQQTSVATFIHPNGTRTNISCPVGISRCEITAPPIIRAGHHIVGWSTNISGTNIIRVGRQMNITANTTFHAITEFQGPTTIAIESLPGDNLTIKRDNEFSYTITGTIPKGRSHISLRLISPIVDTNGLTVVRGTALQESRIFGLDNGRPYSVISIIHSNYTGSITPTIKLRFDWGNGINSDVYTIALRVGVLE